MPNIKPVSDLRNYAAVLQDVAVGSPVFLTKNGRGAYAIVDIAEQEEYERTKAALTLFTELARGKKSGEEHSWISEKDISALAEGLKDFQSGKHEPFDQAIHNIRSELGI